MMLGSEQAERTFLQAIDHTKIESWKHFEYLLCFILENRCLRIYQAYLQNQYGLKSIDEDTADT
jgi:hypothetical protein